MKTRYGSCFDALATEAECRGIRVSALGARNILALFAFGRTARLFGTITDRTSHLAVQLADDKRATKLLLSACDLPTPDFYAVDVEDEAVNALAALGSAVVLKPRNGAQGRGVTVGLSSEAHVREAFRLASRYSKVVLVERYQTGRDYRVLVVDGKIAAVAERMPATVIGDGMHSIGYLINEQNKDPRRGDGDEKPLTKISVDARIEAFLRRSGRTLQTVPARDQSIIVNPLGSLSQGSGSADRTDDIHPEIAALAIEATRLVGLDIAGVDLIASDIASPMDDADAHVIEVNCSPGLRAHLFPGEGKSRNPAVEIVDYLFPESAAADLLETGRCARHC